ncbi:MAG: electron transfer flavoprotein subunit beta/FixA family protein [Clostridia bacterium]|nr:electron transfer flavoprotein subunit beta/FixA family protein [Clostridia bacterium]
MKIIVCIKQVPATTEAKIDPVTKRIIREGTQAVLNPFDLYAIEEAVSLKEQCGGEVIALSMGPENAKKALTEALSMGADEAILLSDRAFGGSDTWATGYALARAIETIGGADLIICGRQAIDGDTAQVGPVIASKLGIMQAANVMKTVSAEGGSFTFHRMNESGFDVVRLTAPALITVLKDINVPRIPTLRNARRARAAEIKVWKPDDIGADPAMIGLAASPTRVVKTQPQTSRNTDTFRIEGEPRDAAKTLAGELLRRKLF